VLGSVPKQKIAPREVANTDQIMPNLAKMKKNDFTKIFSFLVSQGASNGSQKNMAERLNLSQSQVSRLSSGERAPTPAIRQKIAEMIGVNPSDLSLPFDEFIRVYDGQGEAGTPFELLFGKTLDGSKMRLHTAYVGTFIMYYMGSEDTAVASVVEFGSIGRPGVQFRMANPKLEVNGRYEAFTYSGWAFETKGFVHIIARQQSEEYELLTITFRLPLDTRATTFDGIMTGVGVSADKASVAAVRVVGIRSQRGSVDDWRKLTPELLGYHKRTDLPHIAQTRLLGERSIKV